MKSVLITGGAVGVGPGSMVTAPWGSGALGAGALAGRPAAMAKGSQEAEG